MSKPDPAHMRRLSRLQRLREIARVQAMRDTASALGQLARAEEVERRSAALARNNGGSASGADLRDGFAFSNALEALRADARRSSQAARQVADTAQTTLSKRSRERDLVREKLADAERLARRPEMTASPGLARNLNSSSGQADAARRQERHEA